MMKFLILKTNMPIILTSPRFFIDEFYRDHNCNSSFSSQFLGGSGSFNSYWSSYLEAEIYSKEKKR